MLIFRSPANTDSSMDLPSYAKDYAGMIRTVLQIIVLSILCIWCLKCHYIWKWYLLIQIQYIVI